MKDSATDRFRELARALAARDRDLADALGAARAVADRLREHAATRVGDFASAARDAGAEHLTDIDVGPLETDAKHVDCLSFRVSRGRHEVVVVAKPGGTFRMVGPFQRGKVEGPCFDCAADGDEAESALDDRLLDLIRGASER